MSKRVDMNSRGTQPIIPELMQQVVAGWLRQKQSAEVVEAWLKERRRKLIQMLWTIGARRVVSDRGTTTR